MSDQAGQAMFERKSDMKVWLVWPYIVTPLNENNTYIFHANWEGQPVPHLHIGFILCEICPPPKPYFNQS